MSQKAVHIFTTNDLDGKFAASLMYEYFKRYRDDVEKYFFHLIENNKIEVEAYPDDVVVLIKYMVYNEENLQRIERILNYYHETIWIDNSELSFKFQFTEDFKYFNKCWQEWFDYRCDLSKSATSVVYMYLMENIGCYYHYPDIIKYVDACMTLDNTVQYVKEFNIGIDMYNLSIKNAIRTVLNHNSDLDIFEYNDNVCNAERKFISSVISLGAQYISYTYKSQYDRTMFLVLNYLNNDGVCTNTGCAINTDSSNPYIFENALLLYDVVCLYHKLSDGSWVYNLFTSKSPEISCAKIARYLNIDHANIENNTRERATFYSNICLFDQGNEFIIKKKLFSNDHKVLISRDGDLKSIIF